MYLNHDYFHLFFQGSLLDLLVLFFSKMELLDICHYSSRLVYIIFNLILLLSFYIDDFLSIFTNATHIIFIEYIARYFSLHILQSVSFFRRNVESN